MWSKYMYDLGRTLLSTFSILVMLLSLGVAANPYIDPTSNPYVIQKGMAVNPLPRGVMLTGGSNSGSPPKYVASCPAGSRETLLNPDKLALFNNDNNNPDKLVQASSVSAPPEYPIIEVHGAGTRGVNGLYMYDGALANASGTYQAYSKGHYRLIWEPPPRKTMGLRWVIFSSPNGVSREAPYYSKLSPDSHVGWRGTTSQGAWSVGVSGVHPAPVIEGESPENELHVSGAGLSDLNGLYLRDAVPHESLCKDYPEAHRGCPFAKSFSNNKNGNWTLAWEPAPRFDSGERWLLYSTEDFAAPLAAPYYFRLSTDGDYGYGGAWVADAGQYPAPTLRLLQTVSCIRCPPGSYSNAGDNYCSRCNEGYYSLGGEGACRPCRAGSYASSRTGTATSATESMSKPCLTSYAAAGRGSCLQHAPGASECALCPPGKYSDEGAGECTPCPGGFHRQNSGGASLSSCHPCRMGTYSELGAVNCTLCAPGTIGVNASSDRWEVCEWCPVGKYSGAGSTECTLCPAGRFANRQGSSTCSLCAAGSHSGPGEEWCSLCADFRNDPEHPERTGPVGSETCYFENNSSETQEDQETPPPPRPWPRR